MPSGNGFLLFLLFGALISVGLIWLSVVDWRSYRIPDYISQPLILFGFVQYAAINQSIFPSLIGAFVGYCSFWTIEVSFKRLTGKDGLGRGDAKLMALAGAWCGWALLAPIVLIGSLLALIFLIFPSARKKFQEKPIPFAPFLSAAILMVWLTAQFQAT